MNLDHIGVVGFGPQCRRLVTGLIGLGLTVTVYDACPARVAAAVRLGARAAILPADAAEDADLVIVDVPDARLAEEVLFDLGGVGETLRSGGYVLDLSTTDPAFRARSIAALSRFGIRHVDLNCLAAASAGSLAA